MYECISWVVLLLLAQWFFGNVYEAVAIVPNALSLIDVEEPQRARPV
jgi:hypothetical protein